MVVIAQIGEILFNLTWIRASVKPIFIASSSLKEISFNQRNQFPTIEQFVSSVRRNSSKQKGVEEAHNEEAAR